MSQTTSRPKAEERSDDIRTLKQEVKSLKELEEMLKVETDRWSRQVILAEATSRLLELEKQLTEKRAS